METEYKEQDGVRGRPVVWGIQTTQEMARKVEKYALSKKICEADVFRRGLEMLMGKEGQFRTVTSRQNGKFTKKMINA